MEAGVVAFCKRKSAEPACAQAGADYIGRIVDCDRNKADNGTDSLPGTKSMRGGCHGKAGKHSRKDVVCGKIAGGLSYRR